MPGGLTATRNHCIHRARQASAGMSITAIQEMNAMNAEQCRKEEAAALQAGMQIKLLNSTDALVVAICYQQQALWEIAAQLAEINAGRLKPEVTDADVRFIDETIDQVSVVTISAQRGSHMILTRIKSIIACNK